MSEPTPQPHAGQTFSEGDGEEQSVEHAVEDPAQLARAARIVRAGLARRRLTWDEVDPDGSR